MKYSYITREIIQYYPCIKIISILSMKMQIEFNSLFLTLRSSLLNFNTKSNVYYTDTDSLYIENKHGDKLDKAGLVAKNLLRGKKDY